jgi:hypothetical protein
MSSDTLEVAECDDGLNSRQASALLTFSYDKLQRDQSHWERNEN